MNDRNPAISKGIDWSLIGIYLLLVAIGLTAIFAATYKEGDAFFQSFLKFKTDYSKQLYFFGISLILGFFILLTDSKFFSATSNLGYIVGIFLLLLVFPFHSRIKGTESIIKLGAFNFQPAEFCKIFVALALSKYLSRPETDFSKTRSQLIAAGIVLLPAVLAILQKETGLALVYFSFFIVMYREGLPSVILLIGFAIAALVVATIVVAPDTLAIILTIIAAVLIYIYWRQIKRRRRILTTIIFLWVLCVGIQRFAVPYIFKNVLQKHQVERIYDLFGKDNPYLENGESETAEEAKKKKESGSSYNVRQSKIAIGSGRIFGKGILKATQTRFDFVPEQRTDFIFCTVGEGFGFMGSVVLLGLYLLLLFRIVTVAERQRSTFSRCYAYGVAAVFFFHIAINVAMTIGLAPVIGIPLPFVSYGGTSLLTFTILLFVLIRLDADRQMVLR
ncbi:MAG: rod shape-determining protein RodA [Chitinophagaceae bacterium]|jgi:rod shape determining protein RodA|nr:rod shape-determining protein RodA [Chitinophagaceae bacterium]MBK7678488.1 rod shape-determining protein RodA [Chitinophagaceae bacterium]MBK8300160.1 rod shape-determining protein RodA [Chitinophagaceae bacterium]MBK9464204.1 rod shape-determining protein RodA [Chitinophagaceae bacterium]MBK9658674.1 rod shape-determining protein RodA [Chitinophagaceae bacterium]